MPKAPKRPRDTNQLAKFIVDLSTGEAAEKDPYEGKNRAAVDLGRLGASKGGQARTAKLSPERRAAIAKKAATTRWSKTAPSATSAAKRRKKAKVVL